MNVLPLFGLCIAVVFSLVLWEAWAEARDLRADVAMLECINDDLDGIIDGQAAALDTYRAGELAQGLPPWDSDDDELLGTGPLGVMGGAS